MKTKPTLRQVLEKTGDFSEVSPSGNHRLVFHKTASADPEYWNLVDYCVSAVCGPYIVLTASERIGADFNRAFAIVTA